MTVVESWIVDNPELDKSKHYGLNVPKGTWMVSMKVDNDNIWNEFVKTGKVKGFSIEGYFADKVEMNVVDKVKNDIEDMTEEEAKSQILEATEEQKAATNSFLEDLISSEQEEIENESTSEE